jgi:hypothetical protein
MATIKSYSDLQQSKKLAEFLPLESADMWWNFYSVTTDNTTPQIIHLDTPWVGNFNLDNKSDNVPCWSLTALFNATPQIKIRGSKKIGYIVYYNKNIASNRSFDIIDACYEMILKLHELNLL